MNRTNYTKELKAQAFRGTIVLFFIRKCVESFWMHRCTKFCFVLHTNLNFILIIESFVKDWNFYKCKFSLLPITSLIFWATAEVKGSFFPRLVLDSKATEFTDVHDPATNELLCRTPKCTKQEMETAVESAKKAYECWKNTSVLTRQTLMLKYQALIREHSVRSSITFFLVR